MVSEGRTETIDGLNVFFKLTGNGESLVCIHGFPSSSWDFEAIWPSLTERFEVTAHDLIGLGKSAKPSQPITDHFAGIYY
jgi:pimeloyl-ACP methyl ester carboxylesterase